MGKAKDNKTQEYTLTQKEYDLLQALATVLSYTVGRDQIISGYLHIIATLRLGLDEDKNYQFDIDPTATEGVLKITEVSK